MDYLGITHQKIWVEYGDKIEFCYESNINELRRIILDKNSGQIVYDKKIIGSYDIITWSLIKIDHSVIYIFSYGNHYNATIFDISEYIGGVKTAHALYEDEEETEGDVSEDQSDQINEIIRKFNIGN